MAEDVVPRYRFGPYTLEMEAHRLLRKGQEIALRPKAFAMLHYLLQNAGRLISKEELLQVNWRGTIVSENTLSQCINEIRTALQDSARFPRFLKTIPRLGFKFIAPVSIAAIPEASPIPFDHATAAADRQEQPRDQKDAIKSGNPLALPDELSAIIAQAVKSALEPARKPSANLRHHPTQRAHEAYLKGRYYCDQRKGRGFHVALDFYLEATRLDPDYALAYAGLAHCYNMLANYDFVSPSEAAPLARDNALRALDLDELLPEAHAVLAFTAMFYEWNRDLAEAELLTAIDLDRNFSEAHHWHALLLAMLGRMDEAIVQIHKAKSLDPVSLIISTNEGWLHFLMRHDNAAESVYRDVLRIDGEFLSTRVKYGWLLLRQKKFVEATHIFSLIAEQHPADPNAEALLCFSNAAAGEVQRARSMLRRLETVAQQRYLSHYLLAIICIALKDEHAALQWLERALTSCSGWLAWGRVDPHLDPVRSMAPFRRILEKVGY